MDYTLSINNQEIWDFFQHNPTISFEKTVLLTVKMINAVINNLRPDDLVSSIQSQILSSINDLRKDVQHQQKQLSLEMENVRLSYLNEITRILTEKYGKYEESLSETISTINTETLTHMRNLLISHGNMTTQELDEKIHLFHERMMEETKDIVTGQITAETMAAFFDRFEHKTAQLFQTAQTPLYNFISATETRIGNSLKVIQDTQTNRSLIYENMNDFLNRNRYKNSIAKGKFGETRLEEILNGLFPSAEILNTSFIPNSGDFLVSSREHDAPNLLFETKDYTRNVSKEEVDKFVRDVMIQKRHGIMISHTSGIVGKKPYQIELHSNQLVIFVNHAEYQPEKIKIAIEMMDALYNCMKQFLNNKMDESEHKITTSVLQNIQKEYKKFVEKKVEIANTIQSLTNEMKRTLLAQMDLIQFPVLTEFIELECGTSVPIPKPAGGPPQYKPATVSDMTNGTHCFTCPHMNEGCTFCGKNKNSLSSHLRGCKFAKAIAKAKQEEQPLL